MSANSSTQPTNYAALSVLVSVFFFWGFIAAGNSVFIPFSKHYFSLDQFQSQLIDFAFYLAYYLGALGLFAFGALRGFDPVAKWGYKMSIIIGLLFSACGAAAMIIAVNANTFLGMLMGLFIVALGFSLQQTAANPFAIALGDPASGSARVNLGGGVNSFGTSIGPIVVALTLFGSAAAITDEKIQALSLNKVIWLYSGVGGLFILAAALFYFSKKLPDAKSTEKVEKANKGLWALFILTLLLIISFVPVFDSYKIDLTATSEALILSTEKFRMQWLIFALVSVVAVLLWSLYRAKRKPEGWGAMKYPQLVLGMLAIFVYVGVEVAVVSNLGELLYYEDFGGFGASEIAPFISMYWGGMMIGRWTGAISAFDLKKKWIKALTIIVPLIAFGIVIGLNALSQYEVSALYMFIVMVAIQIAAFMVSKQRPAFTLLLFALLGVSMMLLGIFSKGMLAVYAFMSGGLFCSIMWPSIFSLSLAGLGRYTTQGAAFLVMMILGGAVIPPIQGKMADFLQLGAVKAGTGIHQSYWLPVLCFSYLAFFAFYVKKLLRKQGIDYDQKIEK